MYTIGEGVLYKGRQDKRRRNIEIKDFIRYVKRSDCCGSDTEEKHEKIYGYKMLFIKTPRERETDGEVKYVLFYFERIYFAVYKFSFSFKYFVASKN